MTAPDPVATMLDTALEHVTEYLHTIEPGAARELEQLRSQPLPHPSAVLVGETKQGKSALVNALLDSPGLSPVDASCSTAVYLELVSAPAPRVRAYYPDRPAPAELSLAALPEWATGAAWREEGDQPPRRLEVGHPAPLLRELSLVDTPGVGGLDPTQATIALEAVRHGSMLVFVTDAAAPLTQPELDFLVAAGQQLETIVFALTKVDAFPGWRTVLSENRARLAAQVPRFAAARWFPVSAQLAELTGQLPAEIATDLMDESGLTELRQALLALAHQAPLVVGANLLRAAHHRLLRLESAVVERLRAVEAGPPELADLRAQRAATLALRRSGSKRWVHALRTETEQARLATNRALRNAVTALQEQLLVRLDRARPAELTELPAEVDRSLQALSVELSQELRRQFSRVADQALAEIFGPELRQQVAGRVNATLRRELVAPARQERGGPDELLVALSAGGLAFVAGRGAVAGASMLGAGMLAGASLLVPVAGLGLGLAAGAFVLYRRRVATDRQQARVWLRETLAAARATLGEEIGHRFANLQRALALALSDALEQQQYQLEARLAEIERSAAADEQRRSAQRTALATRRDALQTRARQLAHLLARAGMALPAGPLAEEPPAAAGAPAGSVPP